MSTALFLMAHYQGKAIIPLEVVCKDYFPHLNVMQLLRKVGAGEIRLPVTRIEASQKAAKGVHLSDLAEYIEGRRDAARKEMQQLER